MNKMFIGTITGYHGLKGDLKVVSDFSRRNIVFNKGETLLVDDEVLTITDSKIYKNNYLIKVNNLNDLNLVDKYIGKEICIDFDKFKSNIDGYIDEELIACNVFDKDVMIGNVIDVVYNIKNSFIKVKGEKEFLIPLIDEYIEKVDINTNRIYTKNGSDLII